MLANGHDQVLAAARHQLHLGATQIKLATIGGVSSPSDPLYVEEFTDAEIQAAVQAASDYGTYVMAHAHAHAHSSAGAIRALNNGVMSIAHGSEMNEAAERTGKGIDFAKKHGVVMGFSTDLLFDPKGRQGELDELPLRKKHFSSAEIMIQATGNGGMIVGMSGKRNPYGKVGVIEKGAMADVLIYSENPLEDVAVVADYEKNLRVVIKDGKVYKNTL